jgi:hypothetical protein
MSLEVDNHRVLSVCVSLFDVVLKSVSSIRAYSIGNGKTAGLPKDTDTLPHINGNLCRHSRLAALPPFGLK